ncbi:MAG TPA: AGE family epimerase/isomerase [Lachnospiraceae bacterium]|nr:AGE family epimerase/isomerase [Lachnospiraceae bacterium]
MLIQEVTKHLTNDIIPFWKDLRDDMFGGYCGWLGYDLQPDKKAEKGCILNSRILWFFSNACLTLQDKSLLDEAAHAYAFLREHCVDKEYGGVYWSLHYDGTVKDSTKHTYNQAFAIYALSAYYDASKDEEALKLAGELQQLIEKNCTDEIGYLEAFTYDFRPESNEKLSENGVMAEKTMNTLLHVFEAYTEYYRVTKDAFTADRLRFMMDMIADKIYNPILKRQEVFFDKYMNSILDLHSYGHDIETAWLVDRGCDILGDEEYTKKLRPITKALTEKIYERAYVKHSLMNECENGVDNKMRIWWVQAEAVVGFMNGYQRAPEQTKYLQAAVDIWNFIKKYVIDRREGSEWFWQVDENGKPDEEKPIVEPWKCPYHNGRMCMEIIRRKIDAAS